LACLVAYHGAQSLMEALQQSVLAPLVKVMRHQGVGRKVVGQVAPLAAGACQIEDGVDDLTPIVLAWTAIHARHMVDKQVSEALPLRLCEVRRVRGTCVHNHLCHTTPHPSRDFLHTLSPVVW